MLFMISWFAACVECIIESTTMTTTTNEKKERRILRRHNDAANSFETIY